MNTQLACLSKILIAAILLCYSCSSQPPIDESTLPGYWYGSLPSNSSIGVVLYYYQENGKINAPLYDSHAQ